MVTKTIEDGVVQLYLDGELKLEQAAVNGVTIGSKSEWIEVDGEWIESKSAADYDTALVGKDASLTYTDVSDDGSVFVDVGGKISNINVNGGTYTGSAVCENATGWYGSGICMTGTWDGKGAVSLTEAVFSGCAVNPLNGSTGHGGAIETYGGGIITVQDSVFSGNSANGTGAAGGAIAMVEYQGTGEITGSTFSGKSAYFGGAIQQNRGTLTVTDSLFLGNSTAGDPTDTYSPGGGALELHQGATATISGSTFSANTSRDGGAIYNDTFNTAVSTAAVDGCVFEANTADYLGGAIYNYASMSITGSTFTGNYVKTTGYSAFGGAVVNTKNGTLTVTGGEFSDNSASYGGAIASFVDYGSADTVALTVEGAVFHENTSASGGGIYIQSGAEDMAVISGSDFSGNTATSGGGAICQCFGAMTVTGGTFSGNNGGVYHGEEIYGSPADYFQGGAIAAWDCGTKTSSITGATFDSNTASYGGAISYSYASAPLVVSDCVFAGNGGEATEQGGALWNRAESTGIISVKGSTFSGNTAKAGGAVWNGGSMKLENVVFSTASDTVYNSGSLTFAGVNSFGAAVVNDGRITFSLASGTDALIGDLGRFGGTGSWLLALDADAAAAGAKFAASAGTFTGSLSVKFDGAALSDAFTLNGGAVGNDLALAGGDTALRLLQTGGALTVKQETLEKLVPAVSKDGSVMAWTDGAYAGSYKIEIAQDNDFGGAIRIATNGTAFDVVSRAGDYSCRAAEMDGDFTAETASWTSAGTDPRQVVSNANKRADVFFASVDGNDVWSALFQARNTVTDETAVIAGRNRIRDTFSGSDSDANILYLSDTENGDALFMDDIYSEYGEAARLSRIREIRAGAGDDVVDMTSVRYTSELAGMTVRGGAGDDVLWGASGGNKLFGDAGNDRISGGAGDDLIAGGAGDDALGGGGGNDTFTFGENWGNDIVSQAEGGTVTLWFASGDDSKWDSSTLTYADGDNSVTVSGIDADKVTLLFGGGKEADRFAELSAAGAFLGSSSEAVFETETARTQGILASL